MQYETPMVRRWKCCCHWLRLIKNTGENKILRGKVVIIIMKAWTFLNYWGRAPGLFPKVYAYVCCHGFQYCIFSLQGCSHKNIWRGSWTSGAFLLILGEQFLGTLG